MITTTVGKKLPIPKDLRDMWIQALRSGQYKQGRECLKDEDGKYCCLGVLCEVSGVEYRESAPMPAEGVNEYYDPIEGKQNDTKDIPKYFFHEWDYSVKEAISEERFNLDTDVRDTNFVTVLATMNDELKRPFDKIADYIEQHTCPV